VTGETGVDPVVVARWRDAMTGREKMLKAVEALPEDASIEDAMERLLFLTKVERGLEQADSGRALSHDEVKERMSKWLN
jgi:predicted transcriptional regulator